MLLSTLRIKATLLTYPIVAALLILAVFFHYQGSVDLFNGDTLMAEEFFEDMFLHNGDIFLWSLPYSSYWLDLGLYCVVRLFTSSLQTGMPAYGALQALLLCASSWFAILPFLGKKEQRPVLFAACALLTVALCAGSPYGKYFVRVLFHNLTLCGVFLCVGFYLRIVFQKAGQLSYFLLFVVIAFSTASDTMFVLWFSIPALGFTGLLWLNGKLTFKEAVQLGVILVLPILCGKTLDYLVKPEIAQTANHIKPGLKRIIPALMQQFLVLKAFFASSYSYMAIGALCCGTTFMLVSARQFRQYAAFCLFLVLCVITGYSLNGASTEWYIASLWGMFILLTAPLAFLLIKPVIAVSFCGIALVFATATIWNTSNGRPADYTPPYAECLEKIIRETHPTRILAPYDLARNIQYLVAKDIPVTPIYYNYFILSGILTTLRDKSLEGELLILPSEEQPDMFRFSTVTQLNGQPSTVYSCSENMTVWHYPSKARIGNMADYLEDKGALEKSHPQRDMQLWQGKQNIFPGITAIQVQSRYRLNRQWITISFRATPEELYGKQITMFMAGNKNSPICRYAAAHISMHGTGLIDYLWRQILWSKTFTLSPLNTYQQDSQTSVFFFRSPDRETKHWLMTGIKSDADFIKLFPNQENQ